MKNAKSRFHSLSNRVAKRSEVESILDQAKQEKQHDIVKRLSALLDQYPSAKMFELTVKKERSVKAISSKRRIKTADVQIDEEFLFFGLEEISEEEAVGLGKVSPADVYQMITDMMINTIKTVGHLPWQKEWTGQGEAGLLRNYVTNKPYRGINQILLSFEQKIVNGERVLVPIKFQQPYYLTMKQIKDQGAQLKKGSKASIAVYYTTVFDYNDGKVKFKTSDREKFLDFVRTNGLTASDLEIHANQYRFLKYYNVFRADDCIGLKLKSVPKKRKVDPIEACQQIIDGYPNPPKFRFGGDRAFYRPADDLIQMPKIEDFTSEAFYYSTFFHEIVHSTGAKHRLDRKLSMEKKKYAFEELIAELGAVLLCADSGILFHTRENSAKYLRGWNQSLIDNMEADNKFFTKAAAAARAAVTHIHGDDKKTDENPKKPSGKKSR